ncbi:hypothetical protein JW992_04950 [candidate division KSB1 bacterium]|nr:hypothetical protein [candidate division KSB1 bacterium]
MESRRQGRIVILSTPADSSTAEATLGFAADLLTEMSIDFDLSVDQDSVRIVIAPSRKAFVELTRELPSWVSAMAVPSQHLIVLKSPRWDRHRIHYQQTMAHELLHLFLYRIVGNRHLPRWLDEGLALFYSHDYRQTNLSALSKAAATHSLLPLEEIEKVLTFYHPKAELAYQQSYSAVHYLLSTYDIEALRGILTGVRDGENLDSLFIRTTGSSLPEFEQEWRKYVEENYRWFWLSELDQYIWIGILILAILAVPIIRRRNRSKLEEWTLEPEAE